MKKESGGEQMHALTLVFDFGVGEQLAGRRKEEDGIADHAVILQHLRLSSAE